MKCAEHKTALGKYFPPAGVQRSIWVSRSGVARIPLFWDVMLYHCVSSRRLEGT